MDDSNSQEEYDDMFGDYANVIGEQLDSVIAMLNDELSMFKCIYSCTSKQQHHRRSTKILARRRRSILHRRSTWLAT